jgi:hypothetical protein
MSGMFSVCGTSGTCNGFNPGAMPPVLTGTCAAAAADGTACNTSTGPGCLAPAYCATSGTSSVGVCRLASGTCH